MKQLTRIITVAGTKGKTTCVRALHHAISAVHKEPILGVDTHRIMLGEKLLMAKEEYTDLFGLGTAVCPGKTLLALRHQKQPVAVFEASVGTWEKGLGYFGHEIGIFTNVYDDHIKPNTEISSRKQLAAAKASYIFKNIANNGTAIYNSDNDLIPTQLDIIPSDRSIIRIACSLKSTQDSSANYVATVRDDKIVILENNLELFSVNVHSMPWLHEGKHEPSLYNGMFVVAALWRFYGDDADSLSRAINALQSYSPDPNGGRMVVRTAQNGAKVIIDFAYERESLKQIAEFARKLVPDGGKVYGVLRMNNARDDDHTRRSAEYFVQSYDKLFIYDMASESGEHDRELGDVPRIIADVAAERNIPSDIILNDSAALRAAYKASTKDTAIVYIIRDHYTALSTADSIFHFKERSQ